MEFDNKQQHDDQDEFFVQGPSGDFQVTQTPQESTEGKKSSPKSPTEGFEKIEINVEDIENAKRSKNGNELSPEMQIENPFKNNLANSENLALIQKLDVVINDNYLSPNNAQKKQGKLLSQSVATPAFSLEDGLQDPDQLADADKAMASQTSSIHQEMVMKRKKNARGKKQNLSIHQFDESMQKTI